MNKMTGDPNQENRPSIFGFETYPCPIPQAQPIDWSRIPIQQISQQQHNKNEFNINYRNDFGNFSFCSSETPHPAQFPFPTIPSQPAITGGHSDFGYNPTTTIRCKRKTESPPLASKPSKQFITEEKMAEHMSKLHISSETATSSKETDVERTKRLYMCEEMRKLQADSILPHALLSRIHRPCTALVLWEPPRKPLDLINVTRNNQQNQEENGNNNEENLPDNNRLDGMMDLDNI